MWRFPRICAQCSVQVVAPSYFVPWLRRYRCFSEPTTATTKKVKAALAWLAHASFHTSAELCCCTLRSTRVRGPRRDGSAPFDYMAFCIPLLVVSWPLIQERVRRGMDAQAPPSLGRPAEGSQAWLLLYILNHPSNLQDLIPSWAIDMNSE